MVRISKSLLMACAVALQVFMTSSCGSDAKKAGDARINALVTAKLGDIMKGDYKNALSLIASKGMYVKTDIFGNEHVFKQNEKALNYIASVNSATLDVMDSLALTVEAVALEQPEDSVMSRLNALVKKYVALCKNPTGDITTLLSRCESLSADIRKAVSESGEPDNEKFQMQLAMAGNAVMSKEMKAAQLAAERDQEAAKRFKADGEAFLAENAKKKGVVSLPSGLQYRVIKKGSGARPKDDSQVTVAYEGRFIDGTVFDSTDKNNGGKPVTLGMGSVVRGWNEALKLMPVGSEWEIFLPYELGYGEEGSDGVPPCSALVFRLKLIAIK